MSQIDLPSMHWLYRQPETERDVRTSPLHARIAAAGACFGDTAGWERANFLLQGPGAEAVTERACWHGGSKMVGLRT